MNKRLVGFLISFLILGLFVCSCRKKDSPTSSTRVVVLSITADEDSLKADGNSTTLLTITAKWSDDNSVASNLVLNFSTSLGSITPDCDTTDTDGIATATLKSGVVAGLAKFTISYETSSKKVFQIKFYAANSGFLYVDSLYATPPTVPVGSDATINAILKYTNNDTPAVGLPVCFSSNLGTLNPVCDTTDSAGKAVTTLGSSDTAGIATVIMMCGPISDTMYVIFTSASTRDTVPASIVLYSITPTELGVKGTGENETSTLVFQVRDKAGKPVDGTKTVNFSIVAGPTGGEYLDPPNVGTTRDQALATTYLNSGTKSGAVQIQASVNGTTISSTPVKVTIVSGLPDSAHFSIVPEKLNCNALWIAGVMNKITAYVGDIYGNPTPDNTVVWFSTDCGLIQPGIGSTLQGITSNNLVSCAPWPPAADNGFFYVYGETISNNNVIIRDSTRLLWSHTTILTITPGTFNIPNGGSQDFIIRVHDFNDNPLTEGTTITSTTSAGELRGDVAINLPDTQSPSWTTFQITVLDDQPDTVDARSAKVSVSVASPNGSENKSIYGTIN